MALYSKKQCGSILKETEISNIVIKKIGEGRNFGNAQFYGDRLFTDTSVLAVTPSRVLCKVYRSITGLHKGSGS